MALLFILLFCIFSNTKLFKFWLNKKNKHETEKKTKKVKKSSLLESNFLDILFCFFIDLKLA